MIRKLWTQAVNNLDSALAIIISIIAAILGVFNNDQAPLLSAISGALGLIALGMIKDRNARDELLKQVQQLKAPPSVDTVFLDRSRYIPFKELTASAKKIYLVGPSLVSLFNDNKLYFQDVKLKEHKATIQAIIMDPQSPAIKSAENCVNQPPDTIKAEIKMTIKNVHSILDNLVGTTNGKLELKTLPTYLNFSMVLIDPDMPNGKIIIEFIGYRTGLHNIPHIELTPFKDKDWYQFFLQQYNNIYTDSKICLTN